MRVTLSGWPNGIGTYTWNTGAVYTGGWKKGLRHDVGKYTYTINNEQVVKEGLWKYDAYKGPVPVKPAIIRQVNVDNVITQYLGETSPPTDISFQDSGGHADFAEASMLGSIDPQQVDKSLFGKNQKDQKIGLSGKNAGRIDYEKGKAAVNFRADRHAETVKQFLQNHN